MTLRVWMILVGYVAGFLAIGRCLVTYYGLDSGERLRWWFEAIVRGLTGDSP